MKEIENMCCAYCDMPIISGSVRFYGSDVLHSECYEDLNEELAILYSEEEPPRDSDSVPLRFCPCSSEDRASDF